MRATSFQAEARKRVCFLYRKRRRIPVRYLRITQGDLPGDIEETIRTTWFLNRNDYYLYPPEMLR